METTATGNQPGGYEANRRNKENSNNETARRNHKVISDISVATSGGVFCDDVPLVSQPTILRAVIGAAEHRDTIVANIANLYISTPQTD